MTANHIALVIHDFSTGGSERIAIRLANRWAASGREVTILCGTEAGPVRALVAQNVRVEACIPELVRSPWSRLLLGWRLARLVRKHRPDIVFAPGNFHLVVLAVLARRHFPNRPAFLCKLSNPIGRSDKGSIIAYVVDIAIRSAVRPVNALVAMSASLKMQAQSVFGDKLIVQISEPILDDVEEKFSIKCNDTLIDMNCIKIVCIGRLCDQKDFLTAIRAFAELDAELGARLLILGDGPQHAMLLSEATRLGVATRVKLAGYVPDVQPYLRSADLFLMTSRYEGYPAVLIEAIAYGLPIVTTDCSPAIAEIMTAPRYGRVVASRTPHAIADAITAQLRERMPDFMPETSIVEAHRIGASATAYLDLFDRMTA